MSKGCYLQDCLVSGSQGPPFKLINIQCTWQKLIAANANWPLGASAVCAALYTVKFVAVCYRIWLGGRGSGPATGCKSEFGRGQEAKHPNEHFCTEHTWEPWACHHGVHLAQPVHFSPAKSIKMCPSPQSSYCMHQHLKIIVLQHLQGQVDSYTLAGSQSNG